MTDDIPLVSCCHCVYWQRPTREHAPAECHLAPPVVDFVNGKPLSAWPTTLAQDWCGEFSEEEIVRS